MVTTSMTTVLGYLLINASPYLLVKDKVSLSIYYTYLFFQLPVVDFIMGGWGGGTTDQTRDFLPCR